LSSSPLGRYRRPLGGSQQEAVVKGFASRSIVTLTIATLAFVGLGTVSATAQRTANDPSFVGTYAVHGTVTGSSQHLHGTLTVNADGTATDQRGNTAHWSNSGKTFTLNYDQNGLTETFVGKQSKKGISSKGKPGTWTSNQPGLSGTWWAVRQP
jgi:hypothetical protein